MRHFVGRPLKASIAFALYVAAAFLVPAVLAWPLHAGLAAMGMTFPFDRLVFRLMELCALVGLWPLLAVLGRRGAAAWGFGAPRFWRSLLFGLAAGTAMMAAPVAVLVAAGVRVPDPAVAIGLDTVARWAPLMLGAALAVAFVEEVWFRGALFTALRGAGSVAVAAGATSLLYALVHFIRPDSHVLPGEGSWGSGLEAVAGSFDRLGSIAIWDSFLALCVAGAFLAWRRMETGGVAECIGIHAGWVIVIAVARQATVLDPGAAGALLVGGYDGVIGLLVATWLVVVMLSWQAVAKRRACPHDASRPSGSSRSRPEHDFTAIPAVRTSGPDGSADVGGPGGNSCPGGGLLEKPRVDPT